MQGSGGNPTGREGKEGEARGKGRGAHPLLWHRFPVPRGLEQRHRLHTVQDFYPFQHLSKHHVLPIQVRNSLSGAAAPTATAAEKGEQGKGGKGRREGGANRRLLKLITIPPELRELPSRLRGQSAHPIEPPPVSSRERAMTYIMPTWTVCNIQVSDEASHANTCVVAGAGAAARLPGNSTQSPCAWCSRR